MSREKNSNGLLNSIFKKLGFILTFASVLTWSHISRANGTVLYLVNGDVVVGKISSIANGVIHFASDYTGRCEIPEDKVLAVNVEPSYLKMDEFADSGWLTFPLDKGQTPKVKLEKKRAVLNGRGGFGHPSILIGDSVSFKMTMKGGECFLRVSLSDDRASKGTDIFISVQNGRMSLGWFKKSGMYEVAIPSTNQNKPTRFVISTVQNKVRIIVDGQEKLRFRDDSIQKTGRGIFFRSQRHNKNPTIEITDFSIRRSPGTLPRGTFDMALAKKTARYLAIANNPKSCALYYPNGKRGRVILVSLEDDFINVIDYGKPLKIPLSKISGIVWPAPSIDKTKIEFPITHHFILYDGTRLKLAAEKRGPNPDVFAGSSEILGKCTIPLQLVHMQRTKKDPKAQNSK